MDFNTIANVSVSEVEPPKELPAGTYIWSVDQLPEQKATAKGNGIMVNFRLKLVAPADPFENPVGLEEYGNPVGEVRTVGFYYPEVKPDDMTDDAFERRQKGAYTDIVDFLTSTLRVETSESLMEMLQASLYAQCLGTIKHVPAHNNPKKLVADLRGSDCAPLEA
jgi:hypothetical protein